MTSTSKDSTTAEIEVAAPALPPDALLAAAADQLVGQAKATGVALTGEGDLLTGLVRQVLQRALEADHGPSRLRTSRGRG